MPARRARFPTWQRDNPVIHYRMPVFDGITMAAPVPSMEGLELYPDVTAYVVRSGAILQGPCSYITL
ncbi:MAG: hypothetical protein AVDCRST_MAG26-3463 [uncultured Chloroflexia bacterium]|uniref:Uncharacterized protein n=1 Tax=uncultured Chloroflexia bacterium TaxID=1672391 RepID=A0A6J4JMC6_9CHLR|nr:MAG: hypothetical protein AVDCRST_MAG26-3463 [uncultured Chloroflexia bacterium]